MALVQAEHCLEGSLSSEDKGLRPEAEEDSGTVQEFLITFPWVEWTDHGLTTFTPGTAASTGAKYTVESHILVYYCNRSVTQ